VIDLRAVPSPSPHWQPIAPSRRPCSCRPRGLVSTACRRDVPARAIDATTSASIRYPDLKSDATTIRADRDPWSASVKIKRKLSTS
jgi:hypothetical protein